MFECHIHDGCHTGSGRNGNMEQGKWPWQYNEYGTSDNDGDGSDGGRWSNTNGITVDGKQWKLYTEYIDSRIKELQHADAIQCRPGPGEM